MLIITPELKREYEENGYLHLRSAVDPIQCQKLIARMREIVAQKAAREHEIFDAVHQTTSSEYLVDSAHKISCFLDRNAPKEALLNPWKALNKVGHALHEHCPVYAKFSQQNRFLEMMLALGQKKPRLIQSMFIFKQPQFGDSVPPHQDATFIYTEPNSVIGLWFALEEAHENNGCLWVLPKGHNGPLKERFVHEHGQLKFIDKKRINWPEHNFKPLRASIGDIIILHGKAPHFSLQNHSNITRNAYTLHFVDKTAFLPKYNWLN